MDELTATARSTGDNSIKTTFSTCYMCTMDCPITVESQGDEIINISHPDCIRATAMLEQRESPKRVLGARIRGAADAPWQETSWDGAIQHAAGKMLEVRDQHGPESVAFFVGYTKEARPYLRRLQTQFGSPHYITESSCCFGATYVASTLTFGEDYNHFFQASRFRQEETKCRIVWSNNPKDSLIPYERHYLLAEADKVPTIAVDPRRTSIAEAAQIHLQPRPGTDGALALGIAHVILEEGLEDADFLATYAHGFEAYREYVEEFNPERTNEITWVPENLIIDAARLYGNARPAQIIISQEALVQHRNGLQNHRAVMLLAALTGNLDVRGGNRPWTTRLKQKGIALPDGTEKPSGMPMGGDRYPVFPDIYNEGQAMLLAEYIESGRIKAVFSMGTNVMMWPNSERLIKALPELDLFVVSDFFETPTTDLATVFLPAATHLERQTLGATLGGRVQYRPAAVTPRGEAHGDTEMLFDMADALGFKDKFWDGDIHASFDERMTPLSMDFNDLPKNGKSLTEELENLPDRTYQEGGFKTPSGKVEFASIRLSELGHDPLPSHAEPLWSPLASPEIAADYPLVLTSGGRSPNFTHSQGRMLETLRSREPHPRIQISPADAEARGIEDGDAVAISSPLAEIQMRAWVNDIVMPGVVHAPHGWPDANINALIPDEDDALDPITGYPPFKSSLCQVAKV